MKFLNFPLIISTWDFGAEANRVAWKILMSRENPLDAVERAINAVELIEGQGAEIVGIATISMDDNDTTRKLRQHYKCYSVLKIE